MKYNQIETGTENKKERKSVGGQKDRITNEVYIKIESSG